MNFSEPVKGRVVALDLGKKRIGVAVCDEMQMTIRPVRVFTRETEEKLLAEVEKITDEFDASALVIGLPLNFDGTESSGATHSRELAAKLSQTLSIPIFLQDERLTSREAEEILRERGIHDRNEIKKRVDMEAAVIILRDFLEQQKFNSR